MTLDEAQDWFGSGMKMMKAIRIPVQALSRWRRENRIPEVHQWRIQFVTKNALLCDYALKYSDQPD